MHHDIFLRSSDQEVVGGLTSVNRALVKVVTTLNWYVLHPILHIFSNAARPTFLGLLQTLHPTPFAIVPSASVHFSHRMRSLRSDVPKRPTHSPVFPTSSKLSAKALSDKTQFPSLVPSKHLLRQDYRCRLCLERRIIPAYRLK